MSIVNFKRIAQIGHEIQHFKVCRFPYIVYEKGQQFPLLGNHINNVWEKKQIQLMSFLNLT